MIDAPLLLVQREELPDVVCALGNVSLMCAEYPFHGKIVHLSCGAQWEVETVVGTALRSPLTLTLVQSLPLGYGWNLLMTVSYPCLYSCHILVQMEICKWNLG